MKLVERPDKKQPWPKIRETRHKNGAKAWVVDGRIMTSGVISGERFFFKTKSDAETKAAHLRAERKVEGTAAMSLPASVRSDAEAALIILGPYGRSLRDAASFFAKHHSLSGQGVEIGTLVDELLKNKERDGASLRYLRDVKSRLKIFAKAHPDSKTSEMTSAEIDDWLRGLPHGPTTRNNYRRLLGVLFGYAVQRGYAPSNPMERTSRAKVVDKPPGILSPTEAANLLTHADAEIVPAIALGLFAGLRPEAEVWRLDWSDVDLEAGLVRIEAPKTKSARHRLVEIADNLRAWLLPYHRRSGPVSPIGDRYNHLLQRARAKAKIKTWPPDALRHGFGSYHYAKFQNPGKTTVEMGHTNPRTLHAHYRARVSRSDADKYWQIMPSRAGDKAVALDTTA